MELARERDINYGYMARPAIAQKHNQFPGWLGEGLIAGERYELALWPPQDDGNEYVLRLQPRKQGRRPVRVSLIQADKRRFRSFKVVGDGRDRIGRQTYDVVLYLDFLDVPGLGRKQETSYFRVEFHRLPDNG